MPEAVAFLRSLSPKARDKVMYNIHRIQQGERNIELFKKLENTDIWEFRTLYGKTAYRLFSFWDTTTNSVVVATHGLIKKTQKTPTSEIKRAEKARTEYFKRKEK